MPMITTHFYRKQRFWYITLPLIALLFLLTHYYNNGLFNKRHKVIAIPVTITTAKSSNVSVYLSALGTVTPTYNVTVKTQVNGVLSKVLFREGQTVKTGDVLAEIDPLPFQAQVTQFEGQLQRDLATLANAKVDLKRYDTLYRQNSISQQAWVTQAALVKQLEGTVKLDQGQLDVARINLGYCKITSPIDGRVGLRLVDPGNFVQTSDTNGIAVINTINPITVVFTLPEDNIPQVMKLVAANKQALVKAYDRNQQKLLAMGTLLTVDNQIDPTTGTIKLKAQFNNADYQLFPNQFVNVNLLVDVLQNATIVPTAAIQQGVKGPFVFLVNLKKNTVAVKPVIVGVTNDDDTTIANGIRPGQSVVIEGVDKLTDGTAIAAYDPALTKPKT